MLSLMQRYVRISPVFALTIVFACGGNSNETGGDTELDGSEDVDSDGEIPPDEYRTDDQLPCEEGTALSCDCEEGDDFEEAYRTCSDDGQSWGECACDRPAESEAVLLPAVTDIDMRGNTTLEINDTSVRVPAEGNDAFRTLSMGEQLAVRSDDGGILGYVTSVTVSEGFIVVELDTESVVLTEFFSVFEMSASGRIEVSEGPPEQPPGTQIVTLPATTALTVFGGFNISEINMDFDPSFDVDVSINTCWTGCEEVCMSWVKRWYNPLEWFEECDDWETVCPIPYPCLREFEMSADGSIDAGATLGAFISVGATAGVDENILPTISFPLDPIGGLGASIDIEFPVYAEIGGALTLSGTYRLDLAGSYDGGIRYTPSGGWTTSSDSSFTVTPGEFNWDLSAQAWIEFGFRPTLSLKIARSVGPYLDVGPYIRGQSTTSLLNEGATVVDVLFGARLRAGGKVDIFDVIELVDINFTLWEWFAKLWTSEPECETVGDFSCASATEYQVCENNFADHGDWVNHWSNTPIRCAANPNLAASCYEEVGVTTDRPACSACGNNVVEEDEVCDGTFPLTCLVGAAGSPDDCYFGFVECAADCQSVAECRIRDNARCGNGVVEGCEECEPGDTEDCWDGNYAGTRACTSNCTYPAECDVGSQGCGNGIREGTEICDGDDQRGFCGIGLYDGTMACDADCSGWTFANGNTCDIGSQACGNGIIEGREACDDGDADDCTSECASDCTGPAAPPVCGNFIIECDEECDDGPNGQFDCNNAQCTLSECGDGILNPRTGEECDDGAANHSDTEANTCRTDCSLPSCGDGVVDLDELCDGGDDGMGHPCEQSCRGYEVCGDGRLDPDEICDDGDTSDCTGDCAGDCSAWIGPHCGNGAIDCGETCENSDPDDLSTDNGCDAATPNCQPDCITCSAFVCGDGIVDPGEVCDGFYVCNGPGFTESCTGPNDLTNCESGITECVIATGLCSNETGYCTLANEDTVCDPGENCLGISREGVCNSTCSGRAVCGDGIVDSDTGEECDDGVSNSDTVAEACRTNCELPTCGDGVTDDGEECDDGGMCDFGTAGACTTLDVSACDNEFVFCTPQGGDGCSAFCTNE